MTSKTEAARRRWIRETADRTKADREAIQAEAHAGAASLMASAISLWSDEGGEATVHLRDGGLLYVHAPSMGLIATIRAGDGWATAILSHRVLGAPDAATHDAGDGVIEPVGLGEVAEYHPNVLVRGHWHPIPQDFAGPVARAIKGARWDMNMPQVHAEVQRLWKDIIAAKPETP